MNLAAFTAVDNNSVVLQRRRQQFEALGGNIPPHRHGRKFDAVCRDAFGRVFGQLGQLPSGIHV
ncbi:hypothetical protein SDC9_195008 [bioreactor metagenome]|uniref:Uncharacterized protein n=1 Tax=bioreactor metagenome TaxID=1076179 RepID=A0A645I916_9ZZZZ